MCYNLVGFNTVQKTTAIQTNSLHIYDYMIIFIEGFECNFT